MAVTNNIREIREQRGIYQDDLAAAIGYSTKTVGRIERGDSTPSAEFMLRISKYFNLLVEDVFHEITANVVVMSIKRLLHSLIAFYLACFLTTQEKYFYPRPTCIFRI